MKQVGRKIKSILVDTPNCLLYIEHLGCDPLNKVIFVDGRIFLVTGALKQLFMRIKHDDFFQINKGKVINLSHVQQVENLHVSLSDGSKHLISRRKLKDFLWQIKSKSESILNSQELG